MYSKNDVLMLLMIQQELDKLIDHPNSALDMMTETMFIDNYIALGSDYVCHYEPMYWAKYILSHFD